MLPKFARMVDRYFRDYFWTAKLLMLALVAGLVANVASTLLRGALEGSPIELATRDEPSTPARFDRSDATRAFLERNLFHARIEAYEDPAVTTSPRSLLDGCAPAPPGVVLLGTIVGHTNDDDAVALFGSATKEIEVRRLHEQLRDSGELVFVDARRAVVVRDGRCALYTLDQADADVPTERVAMAIAPPMLEPTGEHEWTIARSELEKVLADPLRFSADGRIVPAYESGRAAGFKLIALRADGLYPKLGLQNGDVVKRMNGYEIGDPARVLEVYGKLKDATTITVDLVRRGRAETMTYRVR